jgi:hypothetical protein
VKGTYEFWTASHNYQQAKRANKKEWEAYEKAIKMHKEDGYKEKAAAVKKVTEEFEKLEKSLVAAGAKTFKQLYPDIPEPESNQRLGYRYAPPKAVPYSTDINFQIADLNSTKKSGYIRLFEAAWRNDLETVKALTLAPWELDSGEELNPPLRVAVRDSNGFSPFSIAVLCQHFELGQKIVEICAAQYREESGKPRVRWNTRPTDSDAEGDSDESDDENELPIYSELVNDKYTIDNLDEVSNIVKSDVLPLTMVEWDCFPSRILESAGNLDKRYPLLEHSVVMNDMELFSYIMTIGAEQQALLAEEADDQKCYTVPRDIFRRAIRLGRTEILAEMVCVMRCSPRHVTCRTAQC